LRTSKAAFSLGYRSGLEKKISDQIVNAGIELLYETDKIHYVIPSRQAKYTPDFKLPKLGGFFFVETKGIWTVQDRAKHILVKQQCPDIDIRFVFSNQNARLYKGSPTTYAMYCEKHGFRYAAKLIPDDWLEEAKEASKCEFPNK
jgi:hypothetical protein